MSISLSHYKIILFFYDILIVIIFQFHFHQHLLTKENKFHQGRIINKYQVKDHWIFNYLFIYHQYFANFK
jgi:hypothetical protein